MEHNEPEPWALTSPLCMPTASIPLGAAWFPGALQEHPRWMCVSVGNFCPCVSSLPWAPRKVPLVCTEVVSALPSVFPESQDTRGHRSELNCRHVKLQGVGLFSVAPLAELNSALPCKVLQLRQSLLVKDGLCSELGDRSLCSL